MTQPSSSDDPVLRLYLAGKVAKHNDERRGDDWRQDWQRLLDRVGTFEYLSPEAADVDESEPELVFGHDCWLVQNCDVVVVDARSKVGAGTAQEMVIAKYFDKPVLTVLPPQSYHRKPIEVHGRVIEEWRHPFIVCTSDELFDSIEDLARWLGAAGHWTFRSKSLRVIEDAIEAYLRDERAPRPLAAA